MPLILAVIAVGGAVAAGLALGGMPGGGGDRGGASLAMGAGQRPARNVILIIGDGMGAGHRRLIRDATVGPRGKLAMDRLRYRGEVATANSHGSTTDSAAAATALATGVKTRNGAVAVDPTGRPLTSVLDLAKRARRSTGLVTTTGVTDATPAAFGASVPNRDRETEIAQQYLEQSRPTLILGGGRSSWSPELLRRARSRGYRYVDSRRKLKASRRRRLLGLFAERNMFTSRPEGAGGRYRPAVSLAAMTRKALGVLRSDRQGFFLLVEEEAVDEMAHSNNAGLVIKAGRGLDAAVREARYFAARDRQTLVIVVGDHETGGLTVTTSRPSTGDGPFAAPGTRRSVWAQWRTTGHTGADVPIAAQGPGAQGFTGQLDNTDVFRRMVAAAGLRAP